AKNVAKNNNKQKPPNTLLSSQTTHPVLGNPASVHRKSEPVNPQFLGLSGRIASHRSEPVRSVDHVTQ
ncbi:hypothetical protein, partial [Mycolicibacillus koreensis]|uniref:hypothetical protein n=1 Tax=Mycolicibacillus koreensis TaxID=1069220 RepID=UPI001A983FF2